ncbi:MAG: SUMF1/EgtB/PvdO family nonheme iron enzyme [Hyphomicrobiaceae bacterium]
MSRIFLSHSSADNAAAIALRDWLVGEGWGELFLDLDPDRGIAAGERWERALNEAASRCEAVLFLVSKAWLSSRWCMNELNLARRLNKRLFGVLIEEGLAVSDLPSDVTSTWQLVNLATGRDHKQFRVKLPITGEETHVTYSHEGLARLKTGLQRAGLHASFFNWPPETDPKRAPYRGLRPLEADDAGIFFGREAPVIKAVDQLRGLRDAAPPRLLVILGASGAGKSSFLRAGLLPRLKRDDHNFLALPVIRPERAALTGETGLLAALSGAFEAARITTPRNELRTAMQGGAATLKPTLQALVDKATPVALVGDTMLKPPTLIISIDQGEELFLAEAQDEAQPFLALLRDLVTSDAPAAIVVFTIRSDNYERLQEARQLDGIQKIPFDLGPLPRGSYTEVINGPARRLDGGPRALKIEPELVQELLSDIEAGGAKDALPLLAFTLERLYGDFHAGGQLRLEHYEQLGRVKGSIEAAVERAFKAADADGRIPRDRQARLELLRRGLIPWLAGIDPDTGAPRRRVARLSEIPAEARSLVDLLVDQRLLSTDVSKDTNEKTVEPAHEALLRQWGLLQGWLAEDAGLLSIMDGVKRASRDWAANAKGAAWITHTTERLRVAERLLERPDLAANLEPTDRAYLAACRAVEEGLRAKDQADRRRAQRTKVLIGTLAASVVSVVGLSMAGVLDRAILTIQMRRLADIYLPTVLTPDKERALKPGDLIKECASCPAMIVVPAGEFTMGGEDDDAKPVHKVTIKQQFAVAKFEVTFDEWESCVAHGGCTYRPADNSWGRGQQPVINVSWDDAQSYLKWLSKLTGQTYRLLSEAEWEYAARARTDTAFSFGDDEDQLGDYAWYAKNANSRSHPVGRKKANAFGLHDMHGNVWEWVEDCYEKTYHGAPLDGSARQADGCSSRVLRGGSWYFNPQLLRSANRNSGQPVDRDYLIGFRLARTLLPP